MIKLYYVELFCISGRKWFIFEYYFYQQIMFDSETK